MNVWNKAVRADSIKVSGHSQAVLKCAPLWINAGNTIREINFNSKTNQIQKA